jgi:predicted alpha/beta hydrolase family esterase
MTQRTLRDFRVLIVPGLHNSGPGHWQSRWQARNPAFERVEQDDWDNPQLEAWSARLTAVRLRDRRPTLVVAHSFGCLTAVHSIARDPRGVAAMLLVAPADPDKFRVTALLPHERLPCPTLMVGSSNDPWMSAPKAALWASSWGSRFTNAGALGHINAESGLGDWQFGQEKLSELIELTPSKIVKSTWRESADLLE